MSQIGPVAGYDVGVMNIVWHQLLTGQVDSRQNGELEYNILLGMPKTNGTFR